MRLNPRPFLIFLAAAWSIGICQAEISLQRVKVDQNGLPLAEGFLAAELKASGEDRHSICHFYTVLNGKVTFEIAQAPLTKPISFLSQLVARGLPANGFRLSAYSNGSHLFKPVEDQVLMNMGEKVKFERKKFYLILAAEPPRFADPEEGKYVGLKSGLCIRIE